MLTAMDAWNSGFSPSAKILVVWPLRILNYISYALVPLWNAVMWIWKKVPNQILVQIVTRDLGTLIASLKAVADFAQAAAVSVVGWIMSFVCCDQSESTIGLCNPRCYEAGERVLDLMGPMAAVRRVVAYSVVWIKGMCNSLSGPLDFVTFVGKYEKYRHSSHPADASDKKYGGPSYG